MQRRWQSTNKNHSGPGMAQTKLHPIIELCPNWGQTLCIGRCTDLNLSPNGGLLLLHLERAGVIAYKRTLPPGEPTCPLQSFPFCSPGMAYHLAPELAALLPLLGYLSSVFCPMTGGLYMLACQSSELVGLPPSLRRACTILPCCPSKPRQVTK